MSVKVQVVFYSMYGHVYRMAEAVAEGAKQVPGAEVSLYQVQELIPDDVLEKYGAKAAKASTRFGNMAAQMRNLLDQTGPLWMKGALVGKVGSVFASTATQHGGQETTITSFHTTLLHHGMVIVGVPYSESGLSHMNDVTGGTPYGATTLAGPDGARQPSENELKIARYQGKHVAEIASKLKR
jgi:NAD(P)H dehydrogenase (quinone)